MWNSGMKRKQCEKCGLERLHPQRMSSPVSVAAHVNSALRNGTHFLSFLHGHSTFLLWWWKVLSLEQPLVHCPVLEIVGLSFCVPFLFLYLHPSRGKLSYMLYTGIGQCVVRRRKGGPFCYDSLRRYSTPVYCSVICRCSLWRRNAFGSSRRGDRVYRARSRAKLADCLVLFFLSALAHFYMSMAGTLLAKITFVYFLCIMFSRERSFQVRAFLN